LPSDRRIDLSPPVSDEVRTTTCYMCACRCGIKVHLKDGRLRYIEGNRDHPVNKGVLCAKGSAGIMQQESPAKLQKPLKRVGPRGSGEFEEIEWEEALETAAAWLSDIRKSDPRKLAFFTGRDQSQSLTGWWARQFGTPNYAAHGGFCSVNMAAGGLYSIGGSFWEFGEPDWERAKLFMMFVVAEDHDSNPIKIGLSTLRQRGAKFVSVNPVRTGYSAVADEWLGITPGSDGLFVLALVHELLKAGKVDARYLADYTNAPWLVIEDAGGPDDGLFARDEAGTALVWDREEQRARPWSDKEAKPALSGAVSLPDGRKAKPVFQILAERYLAEAYAPEAVAERTGLSAETIKRIAAELAQTAFSEEVVIEQPWTDWRGVRHERMVGRPVALHAMRGVSAHSNGFHSCRSLHLLQMLLGDVDSPGSFRYKPPYPQSAPPPLKPTGKPGQVAPETPLPGPPLGFVQGPEDLLIDPDGKPRRIDKAFSWEAPLSAHGMMHMVITNAWKGDPYKIDTLFLYMANMAWNSAMNTSGTIQMLTDKDPETGEYRIPHIIYSDAFFSETVPYADLVLPDTTYLERWDCISLLDRPICDAEAAADSIRQPILTPDRDVRPFQDVLIDLGARLGLPGMTTEEGAPRYPGGYKDYLVSHERKPGVGPLAGWRGEDGESQGRGAPNKEQLQRYVENGCFWRHEIPEEGRFFKFANQAYLEWASGMGFLAEPRPIVLQLYSEPQQKFRLAALGHGEVQPPERERQRILDHFDPLPIWYAPFEDETEGAADFPIHAVSQRPMAMYHSWGSQNAWLRQIHGHNVLYLSEALAAELGLEEEDWVWVESRHGRIKAPSRSMRGVNDKTVWTWNAIGKRAGAWNLSEDAPESTKGFLLNHLIDELLPDQGSGYRYAVADPVTGQAAWYDLRVRLQKAAEPGWETESVKRKALKRPPGLKLAPVDVAYFGKKGRAS
jgi:anaerobic selenocysteine-containing dehydrogenase